MNPVYITYSFLLELINIATGKFYQQPQDSTTEVPSTVTLQMFVNAVSFLPLQFDQDFYSIVFGGFLPIHCMQKMWDIKLPSLHSQTCPLQFLGPVVRKPVNTN